MYVYIRINYKQIFELCIHFLDMKYRAKKFLNMKGRRLNKLKKIINIAKYASVLLAQNIRKVFYKNFSL